MVETIRLYGVERQSIVDGPGLRYVVFTQGCPHRCKGCHNPASHDFEGGTDRAVAELLAEMDRNPLLRGATLSGGEPFARAAELVPFARGVKERGLDLFCYSGYTLEALLERSREEAAVRELLELLDVLVDGPFLLERRSLTLRFRGSANQRILDVPRSLAAGRAVEAAI